MANGYQAFFNQTSRTILVLPVFSSVDRQKQLVIHVVSAMTVKKHRVWTAKFRRLQTKPYWYFYKNVYGRRFIFMLINP